jgi:hypothetical protein
MYNEKPKSVISPDKNSRWQQNIPRSYTVSLLISNSPVNVIKKYKRCHQLAVLYLIVPIEEAIYFKKMKN